MQSKILLSNICFMINAIVTIVCGIFIFSEILNLSILDATPLVIPYEIQQNKIRIEGSPFISPKEQKNIEFPKTLQISKIQVSSNIIPVGLTPQGAMAMPKGYSDVGWFNSGISPGEDGTAVIAGHYGILRDGTISVFNNLSKLKAGDMISILDKSGKVTIFVVRTSRIYSQYEDTSSVFISSDNKSHLNLITCHGIWNKVSKSYPNRLVIFSDKVE